MQVDTAVARLDRRGKIELYMEAKGLQELTVLSIMESIVRR